MRHFRSIAQAIALVLALLAVTVGSVSAQHGFIDDGSLGYVGGSISVYGTLDGAQNEVGVLSSSIFPQRDLLLNSYHTDFESETAGIFAATAWWLNSDGTPQPDNPSGVNEGLFYLQDGAGSSVSATSMYWLNASRTTFGFEANGFNTTPGCPLFGSYCSKVWDGMNEENEGSFFEWSIQLTASGLAPASWNEGSGFWESISRPSSVSGSIFGIFQDTATNQYVRFEMDLNQNSWAFDEGYYGDGAYGAQDIWSTPSETVPEPATMTLLATGLAGMAAARRKRRKEVATK